MSLPRWSVALAVVVLVVGACDRGGGDAPPADPAAPAGDVRELAGAVAAERGGAARALAVGDVVARGDVIVTGDDGEVAIELRHNGVTWRLGAGQRKQVDQSGAWTAPRPTGAVAASGDGTTAAGRHAEREAADTAASAVAGAATAEPTSAVEAGPAPGPAPDPAISEVQPKPARTPRTGSAKRKPDDRSGGGCDEIACALDPTSLPCCGTARKSGGGGGGGGGDKAPDRSAELPAKLPRAAVLEGIAAIEPAVTACGDDHAATGVVKVKLTVSPTGTVSAVSIEEAPTRELGACVAAAVRRARFARSREGVTFVYPFTF